MSALLWWCDFTYTICRVTLPTERVSWNTVLPSLSPPSSKSRSPRSVWVEIIFLSYMPLSFNVTLPTERVSWNYGVYCLCGYKGGHAPHGACELKSGIPLLRAALHSVTLPTERVSWNAFMPCNTGEYLKSRSPRSVWVEIFLPTIQKSQFRVTLPTERVSWNVF